MGLPTRLFMVSLFAIACGQSTSTSKQDGGGAVVSDAVSSVSLPDLPPGCPPASGNENGIGKPCTKTGNECGGNLKCSCQDWYGYAMPASMPCFCTSVSFGSSCTSACGSKATCCTYDNIPLSATSAITISACFPSVCAPNNQCPTITQ